MRRHFIVSIALLCATISATTSSAQSALDPVLATLRDIRAARGSNAKIQSRLLPPRGAGPSASGLVAAPPPLEADGTLHVYLSCSPLGANELMMLQQAGALIERIELARGLVQARVDPSALETLAGFWWVRAIRSADRAVVRSGSVTTEGDAESRADRDVYGARAHYAAHTVRGRPDSPRDDHHRETTVVYRGVTAVDRCGDAPCR